MGRLKALQQIAPALDDDFLDHKGLSLDQTSSLSFQTYQPFHEFLAVLPIFGLAEKCTRLGALAKFFHAF